MTHYYSEEQTSPLDLRTIPIKLKHDQFELYNASGLFSKDRLDNGTKLLIQESELPTKRSVLDLGCGNGVVGIALLRKNPKLTVTFSDTNIRALDITKKNLKLHKFNALVVQSSLFEKIPEYFDVILSNPPYAAGRALCYQLIEESYTHLISGGTLQLVARHNKGGSMLGKKIKEVFGNMTEVGKQSGFRIYLGRK